MLKKFLVGSLLNNQTPSPFNLEMLVVMMNQNSVMMPNLVMNSLTPLLLLSMLGTPMVITISTLEITSLKLIKTNSKSYLPTVTTPTMILSPLVNSWIVWSELKTFGEIPTVHG
jgi:hypothetical protein